MTEKIKARIFDPFFTTKFAGRGLGLAVVQAIVRNHGGALEFVSARDQGTTVRVLLPRAASKALATSVEEGASLKDEPGARTGTILVVEDEEVLRGALSKALKKWGFNVLEASDGSTAMDRFRTHKDEIGVVLLDVTLPGRSSREVLDEIVRLRPGLKVILTSAYSKETVDASFAGLEVTHFIRKPFRLSRLADLLKDALSP